MNSIFQGILVTYLIWLGSLVHCLEKSLPSHWTKDLQTIINGLILCLTENQKHRSLKMKIFFQAFLFGASLIGTGTIFLMIVSAVEIALSKWKICTGFVRKKKFVTLN